MKGRKVYRDNTIVYPDLYYVWTYMPPEICKTFFRHNKRLMYRKHICGIGYYSRYHARHIISLMLYDKAMDYCHIVKGSELIKEGITTLPKTPLLRMVLENYVDGFTLQNLGMINTVEDTL